MKLIIRTRTSILITSEVTFLHEITFPCSCFWTVTSVLWIGFVFLVVTVNQSINFYKLNGTSLLRPPLCTEQMILSLGWPLHRDLAVLHSFDLTTPTSLFYSSNAWTDKHRHCGLLSFTKMRNVASKYTFWKLTLIVTFTSELWWGRHTQWWNYL